MNRRDEQDYLRSVRDYSEALVEALYDTETCLLNPVYPCNRVLGWLLRN